MIDVQVRAQHQVDRLGGHAAAGQVLEEGRVHHVERRAPAALLVVADAGVDQHRERRRPDDEGMHGLQEPSSVVEELRGQPVAVALDRLWRGVGQEPRRTGRAGPLHDRGDALARREP